MKLQHIGIMVFAILLLASFAAGVGANQVIPGEKYTMTGTATGNPDAIRWYLFGTNYFATGTVSVSDHEYEIKLKPEETRAMASGQYYLVTQHPMYDRVFNVGPVNTDSGYVIVLNEHGSYLDPSAKPLFNVNQRQGANAAQALTDDLKSQNIDDMFATTVLVVGTPYAKTTTEDMVLIGNEYVVSGTTTGHTNEMVTVELSGIGFVPVDKETVLSDGRNHAVQSVRIDKNGEWKTVFDTTGMEPGEYTVTVTVGQLSPETFKMQMVQSSDEPVQAIIETEMPTPQPSKTPEEPVSTVPQPGFGLLALAGIVIAGILRK